MESADYYIGVDVGTASVRAGLVTSQGKVLKISRSFPGSVYQLYVAQFKHYRLFSGCGSGCAGGGCGEQKTWPISTKQSGGVYPVDGFVLMAVCDGGKGDGD